MLTNKFAQLLVLLLVSLLLPAASQAADDKNAIVQATKAYITKEMAINDPVVTVEKMAGGFARVQVKSGKGAADPATAFLKQENGKWKVLTLGTSFEPEDYKQFKIPAALQN